MWYWGVTRLKASTIHEYNIIVLCKLSFSILALDTLNHTHFYTDNGLSRHWMTDWARTRSQSAGHPWTTLDLAVKMNSPVPQWLKDPQPLSLNQVLASPRHLPFHRQTVVVVRVVPCLPLVSLQANRHISKGRLQWPKRLNLLHLSILNLHKIKQVIFCFLPYLVSQLIVWRLLSSSFNLAKIVIINGVVVVLNKWNLIPWL